MSRTQNNTKYLRKWNLLLILCFKQHSLYIAYFKDRCRKLKLNYFTSNYWWRIIISKWRPNFSKSINFSTYLDQFEWYFIFISPKIVFEPAIAQPQSKKVPTLSPPEGCYWCTCFDAVAPISGQKQQQNAISDLRGHSYVFSAFTSLNYKYYQRT